MDTGAAIFLTILLALVIAGPAFGVLWWLTRNSLKKHKAEVAEYEAAIVQLNEQREAEISEHKVAIIQLNERLAPITSIEAEIEKMQAEHDAITLKMEEARTEYREKRGTLDRLLNEIAIYDERLSFAEHGLYEPHFDFGDSEGYKQAIKEVRERQRKMVSYKTATICPEVWTLNGSSAKGSAMVNRQSRLTLRAFNNECEAAISNTRWNNVNAMEKRIVKAAEAIDQANASMKLTIHPDYLRLKLEELFLTHEYREKQKEEREERAELARAEREEKHLLEEARKAELEEQKYQEMLERARKAAGERPSDATLLAKIEQLESALAEAHEKAERAKALAEMTKTGYVYIISNIGSFGEGVVKIGLTRRLNPDDRVKELGDASVPFGFDTHAMIYSEEAPALEAALHAEFAERRINMANMRKEFFRVALDEIEAAVSRLAPDASFFKDREAQDWHETLARRNAVMAKQQTMGALDFPAEI
ncbi:DUF4041 domain-containing protein [Altererythrobacter litoralis]|uniref:DUF4041 domain-containing protein n=1 Tax=Altererythrobacter litoralis TaxID=3113904 RepID=A0ABU7GIS4_9SPHN|nr:DUF4041 domain-containing protein [Erythrobacteraceae bacterium 1XM1-14]